MDKKRYLHEFAKHLHSIPVAERQEILAEIESHFTEGIESGRSEWEVCSRLGDPKSAAQAYIEELELPPARVSNQEPNPARSFIVFLALLPINFFLLVGPGVVLATMLVLAWVIPAVIFFAMSTAVIAALFSGTLFSANVFGVLAIVFFFIGSIGLIVLTYYFVFAFSWAVLFIFQKFFQINSALILNKV